MHTEQEQKHQEETVLLQSSQHDQYCSALPTLSLRSSLPLLTLLKSYYNLLSKSWACPVLGNRNETHNVISVQPEKNPSSQTLHDLEQNSILFKYVDWIKIYFCEFKKGNGVGDLK